MMQHVWRLFAAFLTKFDYGRGRLNPRALQVVREMKRPGQVDARSWKP